MLGYSIKNLIRQAQNVSTYYRFQMYRNTVEYLRKRFPYRATGPNRQRTRKLQDRISKIQAQIEELTIKEKHLQGALKRCCQHPLVHMEHGGYAGSGTSHTGKYDCAIHEYVKCGVCGFVHTFEQEATEEYRNED